MDQSFAIARLLVVSGNSLAREGIASVLRDQPQFEILASVDDATLARRFCQEQHPDLIVLDPEAHHGNGLALIREFRRLHKPARTLVVSMHDEPLMIERAFKAGAQGYLWLHDRKRELPTGLQMLLEGRRFLSTSILHVPLDFFARRGSRRRSVDGGEELSEREMEVFCMIGSGMGIKAIATELSRSVKTVESHQQRIKQKLGLASAADLRHCALERMKESTRHPQRGVWT